MRAPAALSLLVLAACLLGCGCLRNRPSSPAAGRGLARGASSEARAARVASLKRWVYLVVRAAAEHGKELGPVLFGSGPESFMATLGQGDDEAQQGCSQADNDLAERFMTEKAEKWVTTVADVVEPYLMNITDPSVEVGATFQIAMSMGKDVSKVFKQITHEMPKSCNAQAIMSNRWPQVVTCAHQMTNMSKPCIRCGSRFFEGWTSGCQDHCVSSMLEMAGRIGLEMVPVAEEMGAAAASGQMTPEQEKNVMQKVAKMEVKVAKSMKILVPCMKCSHHKVSSMLTCMNVDETFTEDLDSAMKSIEDMLTGGNLTVDLGSIRPRSSPRTLPVAPLG